MKTYQWILAAPWIACVAHWIVVLIAECWPKRAAATKDDGETNVQEKPTP